MYPPALDPSPYPDASDLLGAEDPPLFEVVNPQATAPILLISDHNSNAVPAGLDNLGLGRADLARHIAYDIGACPLSLRLARRLGAVAVRAGYSRLLIDCNRAPGDPASIPEVSDGTPIPGNRALSEDDKVRRQETFFWPYHHAIGNALAHLWRIGPPPALFSIHTFTPSLGGRDRYWHIGVLWNRDPRMAVPLIERLRREDGLHVGDNEPYSGRDVAYSIDLHAASAGLPHVAVEVRQDLVRTEAGANAWADRLADALAFVLTDRALHRAEMY